MRAGEGRRDSDIHGMLDQELLQFGERLLDRVADGADSKRNSTLLASNCAISAASPIRRFSRSLSSLMMVRSSCLSSGE